MNMNELIKAELETTKGDIVGVVKRLTKEQFYWQPAHGVESIGLLYYSGIRDEDALIHMAQGKPQLWESEKWYQRLHQPLDDGGGEHWNPEQIAAWVVPDVKLVDAYGEAVRKATLEYLHGLKLEDFDKPIPTPQRYWNTIGLIFVRLVTHTGSHRGKIGCVRDLLPGGFAH